MTTILSNDEQAIISKVQKLLALAQGNTSEAEAQVATAKAMELLAAYNLDMATVGDSTATKTRDDKKLKGGLYGWQRQLWEAVCGLNFCAYQSIRGLKKGSSYEHRIIGSQVNVIAARSMADYLQQTVERLAQTWSKEQGYKSCFVRDAIAYREGMAMRLGSRLYDLRQERIAEDRKKAQEAASAAYAATGGNMSTALVLADVILTEEDLNDDHLLGYEPGTHSRWRAERNARRAAAQAAANEALRIRDEQEAANPALREERLARENTESERIRKENAKWWAKQANRKERPRARTAAEKRQDLNGFYDGYDAANDIGLDTQVKGNEDLRRIG